MLEHFFMSQTRIRLLTIFLTHPDEEYYVRELAKLVQITLPSVHQEIKNLEAADFIRGRKKGTLTLFKTNKAHPLYPELKSIIYKTSAIGTTIKEQLQAISDIDVAVIYGSVAKDKERPSSDIDILIIGTPDEEKLYNLFSELEESIRREINFVTISPAEWKEKVKAKSGFVMDIIENKTITLIGDVDAFSNIGK